jgi:acetyl esterase/lipase
MPGTLGTRTRKQTLNGVPTSVVAPNDGGAAGAILYLHGGAFCLGHAGTHRAISTRLALAADATVYVPNYRLAPEHPWPAALDDALGCYQALLEQGHRPQQIVLAGDSAGGALALAVALRLKQRQQVQPAGLLLLSPVTDPTLGGTTLRSNARIDPMLRRSWVEQGLRWYAAPAHEPAHHPLEQDLAGLPPMLIQVGEREILLSDATRLAEHASRCGVRCRLEIHAGRWHVFQLQAFYLPSIARAIRTLGTFARERFGPAAN